MMTIMLCKIIVIFPAVLLRVTLHQDGQVVKALDVRCNGHMSTWVHTPLLVVSLGLPRWCSGRESACQRRRHRRCGFNPWAGTIPWRRKRQLTPVFLPRESHGQRSLAGYSPWGRKKSDTTEQLIFYFIFYSLANAGYTGLIPGPGRSHMSQGS